ncbi:MAG: tripartite tricarboxylate transporter TctB family protein [Inquilinaceae bacterium]
MKLGDTSLGLLLVVAGLAIFVQARTFPALGGMTVGPDLFPSIAAVGLMGCGVVIAVQGMIRGRAGRPPAVAEGPRIGRGGLIRLLAVPAAILFFGLALNPLGFHITAAVALFGLLVAFGIRILPSVAVAVPVTIVIHGVFYSLLRVPLPWGLLTPFAW